MGISRDTRSHRVICICIHICNATEICVNHTDVLTHVYMHIYLYMYMYIYIYTYIYIYIYIYMCMFITCKYNLSICKIPFSTSALLGENQEDEADRDSGDAASLRCFSCEPERESVPERFLVCISGRALLEYVFCASISIMYQLSVRHPLTLSGPGPIS